MSRKKILLIQNCSHLYPLDEKIKPFLSHIKDHYGTFVESVQIRGERSTDSAIYGKLPLEARGKLILRAVRYDLVYVRNILDVNFLRGLRIANDRVILELSTPGGSALDLSGNGNVREGEKARTIVKRAVKSAKRVFVDGDHQVKALRKYNNDITICPPLLPHYPDADPPEDVTEPARTIGCAGTKEIRRGLKSVERGLRKISKNFPHIYAIAHSDRFFTLDPPIRYVYRKIVPWMGEGMLADTDIFIFPTERAGNDFYGNNLFVLHALAAKKPCIVWHTEIDKKVFIDGVDMFIVSSEDEFVEKLSILIRDHRIRANMAERGHDTAQKHFSPEIVAGFYIDAFRKILEKK